MDPYEKPLEVALDLLPVDEREEQETDSSLVLGTHLRLSVADLWTHCLPEAKTTRHTFLPKICF